MNKILVIGLDGATFDLIHPYIEAGDMPNLARLIQDGSSGLLRSTVPPMSPPAWNSFITGMNPGKHGVFDFTERKKSSYETLFINATNRQAPSLWHHLSHAGKRVAVLSVPFTFPPDEVNGVMVSGMDAPGVGGKVDRSATHPPELADEIRENVGEYPMGPNLFAYSEPEDMVTAALHSISCKMEASKYLYKRESWDFFMLVLGETDAISHRLWKYCDPSSPLRNGNPVSVAASNALRTIYSKSDEVIGALVDEAPPNTTILVLSDHGHGGNSDTAVHLNQWLSRHGLLRFRGSDRLLKSGVGFAKRVGLKIIPPKLKRMVYRLTNIPNMVESFSRFSAIDWSHTSAYSEETPFYPSIWINLEGREPRGTVASQEYQATCSRIKELLEQWRNPHTNQPMVKRVWHRDELYHGSCVDKSPDLIIEWCFDGDYSYVFRTSNGSESEAVVKLGEKEKNKVKSGDHRDDGILIAKGPHIRPGSAIDNAELIDVMPTVLHLAGLSTPAGVDGKVLTDLFTEEFSARNPLRRSESSNEPESSCRRREYSEEDEEVIRTRLKELGYIE
jgi:predicted AlkP superfamily phosphohydrolase/phosphomutase